MVFEGDCMGGLLLQVFFSVWICNFFANVLEFWLGDGGGLQILHKRRMQIYPKTVIRKSK